MIRLLVLGFLLLAATPASAYIEDDNTGMTEADAGEQNTNMYKLNARGEYFVKKLKKIDEYSRKGLNVPNLSDAEDLSSFEQKNDAEMQNKKVLAEAQKVVADPLQLKIDAKPETYAFLTAADERRDTSAAAALQRQLKGRF